LPPTAESAYFRARNPRSWWWSADHDFLASILLALQGANWQRGGGKGEKPKRVERPKEAPPVKHVSADELAARRAELDRRRKAIREEED